MSIRNQPCTSYALLVRLLVVALIICTSVAGENQAQAQSGTWISDASDNWSTASRWSGATVANGAGNTANFTANITTARTITLDTNRTIGSLVFSDNGANGSVWAIQPSTSQVLTLSVGSINTITNAFLTSSIAGTAGITKTGAGTLTLNGNAANTFTGTITISQGTLELFKSSDAIWAIPGNQVNINGGTLLRGNSSYSMNSGCAITLNSGTWNLNNFDQDIGTFTYLGGTVQNVASYVAAGSTNGLRVTGTVWNGSTTSNALTLGNVTMNNSIKLTSNARNITFDATNNGTGKIVGDVITQYSGGLLGFIVNDGTAAVDMEVTGALLTSGSALNFSKTGSGTLRLSGTTANASSGAVYGISSGTLELNKTAGVNAIGGSLSISGGAAVRLLASNQIADTTSVSLTSSTAIFDLGGKSEVIDSISGVAGTFITLGSGALTVNQSFNAIFAGTISDTGTFTKSGTSNLTLSGANTHSGSTTISAGTLTLSGSGSFASSPTITVGSGTTLDVSGVTSGANFSGSSFALASGQTLRGQGIVTGSTLVQSGATLSPGLAVTNTAPGTLTVNGTTPSVTMASGSKFAFYQNTTLTPTAALANTGASGTAGTINNLLSVNGTFTVADVNNLTILLNGDANSFSPTQSYSFKVVGATNAISAITITNQSKFDTSNFANFGNQWRFDLSSSGSSVYLNMTPVPEPALFLALSASTLGLGRWHRRRGRPKTAGGDRDSPQ